MSSELYFPSRSLSTGAVVAGFSTRGGGDDPLALARAAGFSLERLFMVTQVHGARVVEVGADDDPSALRAQAADALVTRAPGVALAVRTADCVPVLLSSAPPGPQVVAAVHGGWRGIVAGVIQAAVALTAELAGAPAATLRAAIGPAIGGCCFEVDAGVAETLAAAVGRREVVVERGAGAEGKPHVDLVRAARWSLLGAGLDRDRVEVVGPCTRCAASLLHSFRREGQGRGRQLSFVWMSPG